MRKRWNVRGVLAIVASLGAMACGSESTSSGAGQAALRGGERPNAIGAAGEGGDLDEGVDEGEAGEGYVPGDGDDLPPDFCEHGGAVGRIDVAFDCYSVSIISCKDLSNVVVEYEDGTRVKYDGLSGQSGTFNGGQVIVGVWVKAGANHSGDGPGYGERFDAPGEQVCDDTPPGDGDGDACGDQPDEDCGGEVPPPPGDGDGDGDSGDGDGDGDSGDGDGDGDSGDGDGDGDSGDGDGDGDGCGDLDEDCGGEVPPPPDDDGCMLIPGIPCDPI